MMAINSMSASASSQSSAMGKISHSHTEQSLPQAGTPLAPEALQNPAPVTIAGFGLHVQTLSTEMAQSEVSTPEVDIEEISDEAALSTVSTTVNLATQAQVLMQGISKIAAEQGKTSLLVPVSENSTLQSKHFEHQINSASQGTSISNQTNSMLSATLQDNQSNTQVNSQGSLKVSASDLQALLNQPAQAHGLTGSSQTPPPTVQHSSPTSPLAATQTHSAEWAAVRVDTSSSKWGEQMMQVLQDRVTLQAQQNLQEAKIRLDPPDLGKLDLLVRVEGDRLSVQINANSAVTREALMQVSERLRTELQEQNFVHVDVNVGSGSDQGKGKQAHDSTQEDTTIFAARETTTLQTQTTNDSEHWLNTQA